MAADVRLARDESGARRLVVLACSGVVIGRLHEEKRYANRRQWFAVCAGEPTASFEPCYWEGPTEFGQRTAAAGLAAHFDRAHGETAPR